MTELFNAASYLLDRQLAEHGSRVALTGAGGELTYAQLHDRVRRTANGLRGIGLQPEQRVLMCMADGPDFVTVFLAALRMGAVPVPVSTMLRAAEIAELLADSRARLLAVTREYAELAERAVAVGRTGAELDGVLAGPGADLSASVPVHPLEELAGASSRRVTPTRPSATRRRSGCTPRARPASPRARCTGTSRSRWCARPTARRCSASGRRTAACRPPRRSSPTGSGNSVLFPLSVGASAVLEPSPSKPDLLAARAGEYGATLFYGGPTFFAGMLRMDVPADALGGVRLAVSAGESLPAALYQRWTSHFGVDILDGIGMTEMLHIFLSNRPGEVRPGTTGVAVPGYDLRILDEQDQELGPDTPGTLFVRGASAATGYWSRYDASRQVFRGEWLRTGDTYLRDADGYYTCLGRTGDMLKVGGIWVSPAEVENRLLAHDDVAQAVVVAARDADDLEKPVAYVVRRAGGTASEDELIEFCREGLPSFKRPRKVIFVESYPTTATGKIRRVELRDSAATVLVGGG